MWKWLRVAITHDKSPCGGIAVFAELYADKQKMTDILDIEIFFQALKQSGRYPLFTCSCGSFGCGGYYVDIECAEDSWIMRNGYSPEDKEEQIEEFEYRFSWSSVYVVATEIKDYIMKIIENNPGEFLSSGSSGVCDIAGSIRENKIIELRDNNGPCIQAWFKNFYALIDVEATRLGKVFRWYSEESCSIIWAEKELEICHASGWLFDSEEVKDFDRCADRHYNGEKDEGEEYYEYYPRLRSVDWSMKMDGTIMIEFGPEEGSMKNAFVLK